MNGRGRPFYMGLLIVLLVTGPPARAQSWPWLPKNAPQQQPHPAVVRVIADEPDGIAQGSGTLVDVRDQYGLVVTNWHVVRDATGNINVVFPDGFRSAARVLRVDRDWDLAALLIWRPHVSPVPLATEAPRPGDALTIAGYGPGTYRTASGRCTQYVAPGDNHPFEMVEVSAVARQGDSGGPIFNQHGQLAGVLFGSGGGTTSGSYAGRVRQFLSTAWPPPEQAGYSDAIAGHAAAPSPESGLRRLPSSPKAASDAPTARMAPLPARGGDSPMVAAPKRDAGDQVAAARTIRPASPAAPFSWQDIAGDTPYQQLKSVLAMIGLFAILLQFTRGGGARPEE